KNITIAELFKYPSVRELCSYLFDATAGREKSKAQVNTDSEDDVFISKIERINNYETAEAKKELAEVLKVLYKEDEF
ncbi:MULTISPECIES: hypothetical protein, partial [unclassified Serratia (in: enterobacteria)]|uniref:hypothetical protein n=1 Tax=unclassified Serratia (in: enterobacteria) TaxID=2647522 RepID=UPI00046AF52C